MKLTTYRKHAIALAAAVLWGGIGLTQALADEDSSASSFYDNQQDELLLFYDAEDLVQIASGTLQPLSRAPAIASVITAEDIKSMGATNITHALESVPGLHISTNYQASMPIFVFRGMFAAFSPQALIMINGIAINTLFSGNPDILLRRIPVESVSRIEVIRGPGSSVYGADAFAGVINIITKTSKEIAHDEFGIRYGSFNTKDSWLVTNAQAAGFNMSFFLEYHSSDGHKEKIDADSQTLFDTIYGTSASHAPGPVNLSENNIDLFIDIDKDLWRLRAGYLRHSNLGVYTGVARALDPDVRLAFTRRTMDLTWHNPALTNTWDLKAQVSYLSTRSEMDKKSFFHIYPPGTTPFGDINSDTVPDAFPDGMLGSPQHFEHHYRAEVTAQFKGFDRHLLLLGMGWHLGDVYKITENRNFGFNPATNSFQFPTVPDSPVFSVSDTEHSFMDEGKRENYHLYAQDIWQFSEFWELTAGIRYDHFSDFGETTNPRVALIWLSRDDLTTKLLYGEAFRSPTFAETRAKNNPAVWGNPNLKAETVKTTELAFMYRPHKSLDLDWNIFHYDWKNRIEYLPDPNISAQLTAQNAGQQTGHGMELTANWRITNSLQVKANYSKQRSTDETSNEAAGNAPHWQSYFRADWQFMPKWKISSQLNWLSERHRAPGDSRKVVDEFKTVDITLRGTKLQQYWEIALSVHNLFDEEVREPSLNVSLPTGGSTPLIPNDLPQAGRNVFAEIRYFY